MPFRLAKVVITALLALASATTAAQAQSASSVLREFGFLGDWSVDCRKPPGPDNSRRKAVAARRGAVTFVEDLGEDYLANKYVVRSARRIAGDKVAMRVELNGEITQDITVVKQGGRLRTTDNVNADGKALVKDGVVLSTSGETPWMQKCR